MDTELLDLLCAWQSLYALLPDRLKAVAHDLNVRTIDSIEHQRDAKARTNEEGQK